MLPKNSLRYLVLAALAIAVSLLFLRYKSLQKEKVSLIMLASFYPFDNGGDDKLSEKIFRGYATTNDPNTNNPDGFFQYQEAYGELADAARNLITAERQLRDLIPANLDSIMWVEKSVSKIINVHERKAIISQQDRGHFQHAVSQYVSAFRKVLQQDRWMARIDRPEVQHEDSIKLELGMVKHTLDLFSEQFRQRDQIVIDTVQFDLVNITVFELFVVLEYIKWNRYEVEGDYTRILRKSRKQWIDTVESKWKY